MKKYYFGLAIVCLVTLGFVGYVVYQGASGKQDSETEEKARDIATELNRYIASNDKVPESLDEAGAKDVPDTIKYTKKSDQEYIFCATYKTASSYEFSDPVTALSGAALGGGIGRDLYYDDSYDNDNYAPETLYISGTHKKGENCQTVKPYTGGKYQDYNFDDVYDYNRSTSAPSNPDDTERQTDIKALHGQIEAYYAQNGRYPTLDNINDSSFRSTNMNGLEDEALTDPRGSKAELAILPSANVYSYQVFASDGVTECNNITNDCAVYTLVATYKDGSVYSKQSLN